MTVPVENRTLTADIAESEGRFSAGQVLTISAPVSDVPGVVTARTVENGQHLSSGTVLAEVSGRPIIGLSTPFRLYRDIALGDTGPDVVAVQDALREIDIYSGRSDGEYGVETASAVKALYEELGYEALVDGLVGPAGGVESDSRDGAEMDSGGATVVHQNFENVPSATLPSILAADFVQLPARGAVVLSAAAVGDEVGGSNTRPSSGDQSRGALVRLRVGQPSVTVRVGVSSKKAFVAGAEMLVQAVTDMQSSAQATVRHISEFRQSDEATLRGLPGYDATLNFPDGTGLPFEDGDTVVVTPREEPEPKAEGMAVPIVALREDPAGTFVTVIGRGNVPVTVEATGDGFAVITAEGLRVDDQVVISGQATAGDDS